MAAYSLKTSLPAYLREEQEKIERYARDFGLDFFPVLFEIVDYDQMNELAAFGGFPVRYPHWRFGMEYERLAKSAEYGLSRIYEMVINNTPSVAYLLEGNGLVDQKLVMAHVYGHVDFFKNNYAFSVTNQGTDPSTGQPMRKWIDTMANHGSRIRRWTNRVGVERIEEFIDACLSLENLIDPYKPFVPAPKRSEQISDEDAPQEEIDDVVRIRVDRDYMKNFINPEPFIASQKKKIEEDKAKTKKHPERPDRDVLGYLLDHAPLERWEREILEVIRSEAYYFWPQMQTKIMNEGWATYWHSRIMTEKAANAEDIIDYADRCAGVLATSGGQLNPYKLGVELYRDIEERWNRGQFGKEWEDCDDLEKRTSWDKKLGLGRKKVFEVRSHYNDVTFIDAFLTPDFVMRHKMYAFGYNPRNERWEIFTRQFEEVKKQLLTQLTNAGQPFIYVEDSNHQNRGELLIKHDHQGVDLKLDYAKEVLAAMVRVWRRPVELHTIVEEKPTRLRFDGKDHEQKSL